MIKFIFWAIIFFYLGHLWTTNQINAYIEAGCSYYQTKEHENEI